MTQRLGASLRRQTTGRLSTKCAEDLPIEGERIEAIDNQSPRDMCQKQKIAHQPHVDGPLAADDLTQLGVVLAGLANDVNVTTAEYGPPTKFTLDFSSAESAHSCCKWTNIMLASPIESIKAFLLHMYL